MLTATPHIYKMFEYICADVQTRIEANVHYEHGHLLEVIETVQGMIKTRDLADVRFPLVALLQPFDVKHQEGDRNGGKVSLNLVICSSTDPKFVAARRLSCTYIPVLYPIRDTMLESIVKSGYFMENNLRELKYTAIDQMYWGRQGLAGPEENIFGSWVDAIEIKNLELTIKKYNCI